MFWKKLGPNGTRITVDSWKAGSRKGRSEQFGGLCFWRLLGRKGHPKDAFLKTMKIENCTKNKLFIIGRRLDPLKTVSKSGLEKTLKVYEKTIGKSMVFDGPKPLKIIEKQTLFLTLSHSKKNNEKSMPKWLPKVMKTGPKWSPGAPRIDLFFVFWSLEKAKKLDFSMRFWGDQKTRKIDP